VDYRTLFAQVHSRPGLFGLDGSYGQFCAYVDGVDTGNAGRLLTGFREWLVTRLGDGDNLVWRGLVLRLAFPEHDSIRPETLSEAEPNRTAVDTLFALLGEFLALAERRDGLVQIYDGYLLWRRTRSGQL
jgi:hypothetical protein